MLDRRSCGDNTGIDTPGTHALIGRVLERAVRHHTSAPKFPQPETKPREKAKGESQAMNAITAVTEAVHLDWHAVGMPRNVKQTYSRSD